MNQHKSVRIFCTRLKKWMGFGRNARYRFHRLIWPFCLLLVTTALSADESGNNPTVSSDPTKAQQTLFPPSALPDKSASGLELPNTAKPEAVSTGGNSIEIRQVKFEGNTVFSEAELQLVTQGFLNRPLKAADLESLRLKVSRYYTDHGYVSSGALLTSQSVADGVLKLKIIEGRLTDVRQSGQGRLQEAYIRDRLLVGSGEPLNAVDLQDSYRRLLADPLIKQLNGQLLPGMHPGEAIMDVKVLRNLPYQLYAGVDDYATSSVGAYTGRMGGWVDNLLTLGERFDGQFIVNGGSTGYNAGVSIPLTAYDTRASFRYSDTNSTLIEPPFDKLGVSSHIVGFDGGLSQPVYASFANELTLALNFVVRESRTLLQNDCTAGANFTGVLGNSTCSSQVTVLRMSQRAMHRGESNSAVLYSTFNAGLNALGATIRQSDGQSGQFFSWLGQSLFTQRILENGSLIVLKANIQLADTPLLPLERYSIGGVNTVRGYRENTYVRDNGFNANLEFKFPVLSLLGAEETEQSSLFLIPFLDYGEAWNNPTPLLTNPNNSLFSSGIGFNWNYRQLSAEFYWAHAFTPVVFPLGGKYLTHGIQDDGIHFRVNMNAF